MNAIRRILCHFKGHVITTPSITKTYGTNNWLCKCDRCGCYVLHGDIGGITISEKEAMQFKRDFEEEMARFEREINGQN